MEAATAGGPSGEALDSEACGGEASCTTAKMAAAGAEAIAAAAAPQAGLDLESWKGDLQRLHGTIDQVVQSFICGQTRQLDAVAAELASQRERMVAKEQRFAELSDSVAAFVEAEAARLEASGVLLDDSEAEARAEAYDAELPGPPALHRINRLWRKATRAFEALRESSERQAQAAIEEQRRSSEAQVAATEERCEALRRAHAAEVEALRASMGALEGEGNERADTVTKLSQEAQGLAQSLEAARAELAVKVKELQDLEAAKARMQYESEIERDELRRRCEKAEANIVELERAVAEGNERERDLSKSCAEHALKCEQMKQIMDEQERELNQKIDRVQQYVKERQAGALHAEKKQQDAERLAERWQSEVRRLQAEKDKLAKAVLDVEGRSSGQSNEFREAFERQQQEVSNLREALRHKEDDMRSANVELLQQRDSEYQAKVTHEKQREKDRSIGLLRKKEQELHIKDQQLQAAKRRVQELESGPGGAAGVSTVSPSHPSRTSSAGSSRRVASLGAHGGCGGEMLPPLPLSAR